MTPSHYDKFPSIPASCTADECRVGWAAVCGRLREHAQGLLGGRRRVVVAIECYTGLYDEEVEGELCRGLGADHFLRAAEAFSPAEQIDRLVAPYLGGDDPLFGFYTPLELESFLDPGRRAQLRREISQLNGVVAVYGAGALLCCEPDLIVYADMPRWEGQLRQRRNEVSNLGVNNRGLAGSLKYKRSFFVDWRVCDRLKQATLDRWDYLLDTTVRDDPKLITGRSLRATLDAAARRPFRVVPFFDPAPWGGQWLKQRFDLEPSAPNYGWGFDCVPEENSLLLAFGHTRVEIPSLNLVFHRPRQLLGEAIYAALGAEFPIRFDFLDTMQGGNLSLQVHPTLDYARRQFGLSYTQDESYYILDAGKDASVFLGARAGVDRVAMIDALEEAQSSGRAFEVERFVARWPARKHDHFLIPAGTLHCSGAQAVVLEISATPYIFTFKLWDWGRMGLDGLPRPINIDRAESVMQWQRDENWARSELINRIEPLGEGPGWREERTGLHPLQFIETRRHWFTGPVPHATGGGVNVLNLVEGEEAIVESPTGAFPPLVVHYAETFIVPAAIGPYTIRPHGPSASCRCATIKASVRAPMLEGFATHGSHERAADAPG
jgi:mannose-6-phosphate isomerase class I